MHSYTHLTRCTYHKLIVYSCCMCYAAVILVTMIICCVTYYSLKKEMIEAAVEKPDEEKFWDLDEERRRRAAWRNPFKRQVHSSKISPFFLCMYSCHTNVYIYCLYSHTTVFKVQFIYFILYYNLLYWYDVIFTLGFCYRLFGETWQTPTPTLSALNVTKREKKKGESQNWKIWREKRLVSISFLFAYLFFSMCQISKETVIKLYTPVYTPLPSQIGRASCRERV